MDVSVWPNNNPVNDMTAPMSGLINDLDKVIGDKYVASVEVAGRLNLLCCIL